MTVKKHFVWRHLQTFTSVCEYVIHFQVLRYNEAKEKPARAEKAYRKKRDENEKRSNLIKLYAPCKKPRK